MATPLTLPHTQTHMDYYTVLMWARVTPQIDFSAHLVTRWSERKKITTTTKNGMSANLI